MKIYILLSIFFLRIINYNVQAQHTGGGNFGEGKNKERPKIGKISGTVKDKYTKQPIEFATISLLSKKDSSLITGAITNSKGKFVIEEIPVGRMIMRVSFIGYNNLFLDSIFISPQKPNYLFDDIQISPSAESLKEVNVVAENKLLENKIDRKVFNVEKSIVTQGGTAADILEKIPSITIDMDGNISMRGNSNVTILIDGKPSSLAANKNTILQQIPASSIDNVEVISNPSSKYDPDGLTGIINIVLKKRMLQGFNGTTGGSIGYKDRYNANLNLNARTSFVNIFMDYGYNSRRRNEYGLGNRSTIFNSVTSYLDQQSEGYHKNLSHMLKLGFDLYLSLKTTLTLSSTINMGNGVEEGYVDYQQKNAEKITYLNYKRVSGETENNKGGDYNLFFRQSFSKPRQEFTADFTFSQSEFDVESSYNETYFNTSIFPILQKTTADNKNIFFTGQTDYVHPFNENRKLEAGLKSIIRDVNSVFVSEDYKYTTQLYEKDFNLSNTFLYKEQTHSAYVQYADQINKFGFQLGTRVEQTLRETELIQTKQVNKHNYFSIFPTAHILYKLPAENEVSISYTRRINRPSMRSLNPFTDYSDPRNQRTGNPNLKPEYINSYEIGYAKYWKGLSITTTFFYREIYDLIRRYREQINADTSRITFVNLNSGKNFGGEAIFQFNLTNWWDMNLSVEFYQTKLDGSNVESDLNSEGYNWSTKGMTNFKLPLSFVLQLSGMYSGPETMPQGKRGAMFSMDAGLKKDIFNKRGSLSFRVNDVFDTRKFMMDMSGENYTQHFERRWDSRFFTLSFSYRFGKMVKSQQPKKREKREQEGGGDDFF